MLSPVSLRQTQLDKTTENIKNEREEVEKDKLGQGVHVGLLLGHSNRVNTMALKMCIGSAGHQQLISWQGPVDEPLVRVRERWAAPGVSLL